MVEKSRRDRVGLGLIGLGPSWEQVYREPLVRLRNRLTIRLVHDPVEARARTVATELDAEVVGSLLQILSRPTLQGLLVLEPGWCGLGALEMLAKCGKPVFLGSPFLSRLSTLSSRDISLVTNREILERISHSNDQLMPELGLRFTPASCRLRELIATKLGAVKRIEIECGLADIDETTAIVDWFCDIMGSPPVKWRKVDDRNLTLPQIEFDFPQHQSSESSSTISHRTASIRFHQDENTPARFDCECERGHAIVTSRTRIVWRTTSETADESLTDERTETEILIDQFCRRALGGLNPIGRMSEFLRAMEIARTIRRSDYLEDL
jgi:predicted dehydrogenase